MKYLILGSEGQIGKSLNSFLKQQGHCTIEYDIKRNKKEDLRKILIDKESQEHFVRCLNDCDFVFFLAWDVGGAKYLAKREQSFEFIDNNINIMSGVFHFLNKIKKPFLFTSSQMSDMVDSSYGNTKLVGEKYTKSLGGLLVKMWNVYGENDDIGIKSHVITDFVNKAKSGKSIDMLTDGEESRQFLYATDCCEAFYNLSQNYDKVDRNANLHITSFEWVKIVDVAEEVATQMNVGWIIGQKKDRVQNDRKIKPDKYIFNYWKPKTSLKDGISLIIERFGNNV